MIPLSEVKYPRSRLKPIELSAPVCVLFPRLECCNRCDKITSWETADVCTRMNVCSSENISIVVINALMLYAAILNSASFQHVQIA